MPLDFSSKAEPVGSGVLDFSAKAVPAQRKTREQVQADVVQAQMRRDVMSPPEEMSGLEKVAEAAYWPIRALSAQDFLPAVENTVAGGLNAALNTSARLQGLGEYPPEQLPYQGGRPLIPIPSAHDPGVAPVDRALLKFVEGLTTPGNVAMLPVAGVEGAVGNIVKGMFVPPMTLGAVQQGQVALDPSVPTGDRQEAAVSALLSGAMATGLGRGMVPKENLGPIPVIPKDNGIIVPEVLGPKETPIVPPSRQLNQPILDVEVLGPRQLPLVSETMLESIRNPEPIDRTYGGKPVRPPEYLLPREQRPVRITPPPEETVVKAEPKEVPFQNETQPLAESQFITTSRTPGREGVFYGTHIGEKSTEIQLPKQGKGVITIPGFENEGTGSGAPLADAVNTGKITLSQEMQKLLTENDVSDMTWDADLAGLISLKEQGVEIAHFPDKHDASQIVSVDLRKFDLTRAKEELNKNLLPKGKGEQVSFPIEKSDYQQYLDVQKKMGALVEKGDFESAEFRQLWQESENIKNRNGNMPPKPPVEPGESGRLYLNPIGPIIKQTVKDVTTVSKKVGEVGADFIRAYAEPLQEQIGRVGGVVSKKVSEEAGQIISRGKELYGELTPVVDVAKKQVGKAYRGGTGWMREKVNITPDAAQNNFFAANESGLVVPLNARRGMKLSSDANLKIGQMAQRANPGFTATGKLQRIMTTEGYDMIVKGGDGREKWIEGVATLNGVPAAQVRAFFDKMKETFGDPSTSSASLDSINQDFVRKFPKTITHVKTPTGWHEVIVSDPFNYLEQAAQRTAHATAFREVYPLIQHNGKWVQSGKLQATRKAVMKELSDGSEIAKFDNLIKALQGHPLDTFSGGVSTTAKSIGGTIAGPMKALMLSGNFATNLGEVVSGGPSIFLGYKSVGQGLAEMVKDPSFYEQLEFTGARNKAIYNNAFDSSAPVRSVSRQVGNVIRNVTGQQFLNEVQEGMAAASAKVYADRVKSGTMSQYDSNRAHALFRAMGFNKEQATAMVGGDVALLKQFENRAASWLTTGNQAPAEMSRLGASRLFNSVFWFHKYPQMTLNQFRSVGGNLIDDAKAYVNKPSAQTWSPLYHNAVLMGRQLGGRSAQGAITLAILAGVSGGIYGLVQTKREAEDDVMKFVGEGIVSGYGGPLSVMKRLGQNVKGGDSFVKEIASLSAPASVTSEMIDMGMGVGKYQGLNTPEKVGKFLEGKTPASRMMKTGMAVAGLSEKDLEFETAVKGFYKWRREQSGQTKTSVVGGTDEQIEMRAGMQKVKKAIEAGEDWVAELRKVKDLKGAGNALRAGTLLQVNGKALNESQIEALKRRIGANGLEKIQARDAMIREVGRELNEKRESGERKTAEMVEPPKGNLAVDRETEGQRNERVTNRLSPKVRDYLKQNEMENLGYTPAIPRGIKKQQLTVEEARKMEEEYVKVVDQLVGTLIDNVELKKANLKVRQEVIGKMLESSRKVASAKTLGLLEVDKSQQRR